MKRQRTNQKIFKIFDLVSQQIAEVFPYILGFYIVCLIISLFSERWKLFFNWSAFHVSVILLGILVLFARQGKKFKETKKSLLLTIENLSEKITRKNLIKIGFLAIVLVFSLFWQINPINFLVLAYALISILFVVESRVSATIALLFLFFCPILLIAKKDPLAEKMAIYAYDFLIIAALARLREYQREEKAKKVIHSH